MTRRSFPPRDKPAPTRTPSPLDRIDVSDSELFETDTHWGYFERLRKEDPVHYCAQSDFGPYWSVTKYEDVVHVEKHPEIFSSARSIVVGDPDPDFPLEAGFITMDGPRHDAHRKVVQPVAAPRNIAFLEPLIRERIGEILDGLPVGETFDWVDRVSIEVTTGMLATLFDFPYEQRRKLTFWSDMATASPQQVGAAGVTEEQRQAALMECLEVFTTLWKERAERRAHRTARLRHALWRTRTRRAGSSRMEYLGTLVLLIVGGNDTTRNSISGGVLALNENPDEYAKLRDAAGSRAQHGERDHPLADAAGAHAPHRDGDTELAGKRIAKGDKVVMWYVSANRDEDVFERPNDFRIDRENARDHLAFGRGVHFCMGSRIAEMQLRVLWEETLARFRHVEVVGKPVRVRSNFVKGYAHLPVRVHPR